MLARGGHDDVDGLDGLALRARNHAADNLRTLLGVIFIYVFINSHVREGTRKARAASPGPNKIQIPLEASEVVGHKLVTASINMQRQVARPRGEVHQTRPQALVGIGTHTAIPGHRLHVHKLNSGGTR